MKNLALALSIVSLLGTAVLGSMVMSLKKGKETAPQTAPDNSGTGGNVAYVNIDTLESKYEYLKKKNADFKHRQEQMEAELQKSYGQLQNDANEIQKKAQANALTQTEYEAAQKRWMQMQQSLESRKQSMTEELMKDQEEFSKELRTRIEDFLASYNKTHHYDYIMSYSGQGSAILYADANHDITADVVAGMNATIPSTENKK